MLRVLITDTHFGDKNNSVNWLQSQMDFIDNQLIPFISRQSVKGESVRIIHLGDLFDSRSSINPYIAKQVKTKFAELNKLVNNELYIIAGNHDFYSPNSDDVCSIEMTGIPGNHIIRDMYIPTNTDGVRECYIPWYCWKDSEEVKEYLEVHNIDTVYTHADIFGEDYICLPNVRVFSGHIHIPRIEPNRKMYNLGGTWAMDFADNNSDRGFYTFDGKEVVFYPNKHSIKYWRIKNEDIFNDLHAVNDKYELYIDQNNLQSPRYITRLSELVKKYKEVSVIPIIQQFEGEYEHFETYDIHQICSNMVPDHLKPKFQLILDHINNEQ